MSKIYIFEQGNMVYDEKTLTTEQKNEALLVAEMPKLEPIPGKYAEIRYNVEEQKVWYEYIDIEVLSNDDIITLQQEDLNNKDAIAELYTQVMMMDMGGL